MEIFFSRHFFAFSHIFLSTLAHLRTVFTAGNYCVPIKISQRPQIMCQKSETPFFSFFQFSSWISLLLFLLSCNAENAVRQQTVCSWVPFTNKMQFRCGATIFFYLLRNLWNPPPFFLHLLFSHLFPESSSPGWVTFLATTTSLLWMPGNWHYSHEIITLSSPTECHKYNNYFSRRCY